MYQNSLGMMPSVLNTDPILNVPKFNWCTKRSVMYAKVNQMYQNSLGTMPSVLNTDPISPGAQ